MDEKQKSGLDSLLNETRPVRVNTAYTKIVRSLRVILPLMAVGLAVMVFTWPDMEDTSDLIPEQATLPQPQITKNELINPRFESTDAKQQPFTITATKATQDEVNPQLVILDMPTADIQTKDGAWIAAKANTGVYEQQTEKLQLKGNVHLFHDTGYQMETDEIRVNIKTQEAWSDREIYAQGPAGILKAQGLQANVEDSVLIFNGPAHLTLNTGDQSLSFSRILP